MPPEPLTKSEIETYRARAAAGETPSLDIVSRFIATIRKSFLSSPKAVEKGKTTRNAKAKASDSDADEFF
jgi:hypothetical protein